MKRRRSIAKRSQRRMLWLIAWVVGHPWTTLTASLATAAAGAILAAMTLTISSDQNQLFSPRVPFFHDYLSFIAAFPENEAVYVLVERSGSTRPPVAEWTGAADAVAAKLTALNKYVASVDQRVPIEKLGVQGLLFDDRKHIEQVRANAGQLAQLAKLWGEKPTIGTALLGGTPTERFLRGLGTQPTNAQSAAFVAELARCWDSLLPPNADVSLIPGAGLPDLAAMDAADPSRLGYYYVPDQVDPTRHLLLVRVYLQRDFTSLTAICGALNAVRAAVGDVAAKYPQFRFGVSGRPALEADEMQTTQRDSHYSEICALIAVFIGMRIVLRSTRLSLLAELALLVAIGWTFAWATLSVGRLNLLSIVFMIALIGIGMDYLVQILSRYRAEAARRNRPAAVWHSVFKHVGRPVTTACLGAAGAFLVSVFTDFRGAAELGIIAGVGLVLCLLAGHTVLPALLTLFPVLVSAKAAIPVDRRAAQPRINRWWLIGPAIWAALLCLGYPEMRKVGFDSNLLDLQAKNLESVQLVRELPTWSAVVLSKDSSVLSRARDAVAGSDSVARTESLLDPQSNWDWLHQQAGTLPKIAWTVPPDVTVDQVLAIADAARALAKHLAKETAAADALSRFAEGIAGANAVDRKLIAQRLSAWQGAFVEQLKLTWTQFDPPPLDVAALPGELRSHYVSDDGLMALYIYPRADLWQQGTLGVFVRDIEKRLDAVPGVPKPTGIAVNIYHSTESIRHSFFLATTYALGLIALLVWIDLKNLRLTLLALSVLGLGLPMLVAAMGFFGVQWNFANFFGLPILIGAGHEYGVFLVHRYLEVRHDPRRVWLRGDVSNRALLLCAFITTSSFGFFWILGHHEGLRGLGLVMAVGTACIYLSAVLVLRPILLWKLSPAKAKAGGIESALHKVATSEMAPAGGADR